MNAFSVERAAQLAAADSNETAWLIQDLWAEEAVGILGGEPKCCKTFFALDMAVSVASASPCLRHFPVARKGRVLLFPAEDSLPVVYQRLSGISRAAGSDLTDLEIHVITEPRILLDSPAHQKRLADTIERVQPDLLILDPFIRLHGIDENNAAEVAPLLAYLRELQRRWHMAIVLVHHARKNAGTRRPGQALRGSSDLHGWGDSNLYLRRTSGGLTLTTEHRAAAGREDISLQLNIDSEGAPSLALSEAEPEPAEPVRPDPRTRIMEALARQDAPLPFKALRQRCHIRTATLSETLGRMTEQGCVIRSNAGYRAAPADSASMPLTGNEGNGNGKRSPSLLPGG